MAKQKIKDFITQIRGVSYKPSDVVSAENGTPIIRANNIQDSGMLYDELVFIIPQRIKSNQILKKGDIVICTSSGSKNLVGKATTFNGYDTDIAFGAFCKCVRINNDSVNADFIRLFFQSKIYREQISASSTGANINNIKAEHIDNLYINIPTSETQNIAVAELTALINSISVKKQQLLELDDLIKSRFIEMFGDKFDNANEHCKIKDVCTATIGLTYKPENVSHEGTIVLRSGNIQNNALQVENDIVRVVNTNISEEKLIKPNDILMCSRNGSARLVGKSCLITSVNEPMSFGAFMTVVRCSYPYFMQAFFTSDYFRQQLTGTKTASVNQITTKMLYEYTTIKPSKQEENEFADFVKLIDKSKFIVQKQIDDLQELLDSKMDEYFG